ncbi:MAG: hypothetical protein P8166_14555 [Candidatus Thiodiazotropha sp.]
MNENESDPYRPPKSVLIKNEPTITAIFSPHLENMGDDDIVKLNKSSSDINYIGVGSILFAFGMLIFLYQGYVDTSTISTWQLFVFLYFCISTYACFARPHWGDIVGVISSVIFLFSFPIGTMFGILGLRAITKNKQLFGKDRITDAELSDAAARIERKRNP